MRAWLVGPLGTDWFEVDEEQFATAVFADDFRLFRKALVWFQAEKTSPNTNILAGTLPLEQRQRFADLLGWPSDFASWRRLINFILRRITVIPQRLYPEIVSIFEVWQNALADIPNPTSRALLQQCATWLTTIDALSSTDKLDENYAYWRNISDLGEFRKSLGQLLLSSSRAEPSLAFDYLQRATHSERIRDDAFHNIVAYSPILAQSLPKSLVDLSLAYLIKELPDERVARKREKSRQHAEWRKATLAKSEAELTQLDKMALSSSFHPLAIDDFSYYEWERLSIHDDYRYFPASPLRQPFRALFQSAPEEGIRLLRELCNHAMASWRQLHYHSRDRRGTPIPLVLKFPWGSQTFWGTDREYLWFRSTWAPKFIGCGFMALEEWCFAELERGRSVDSLILQVVKDNECIAILGIASMLALHTEIVSETTLPLFTSQRLLAADQNRMVQDISSSMANLMGFKPNDKSHVEIVQSANARPVRKMQLLWMVPKLVFGADPIRSQISEAILNFKNDLPYQYEEQRDTPEEQEYLTAQAFKYAELVEQKNYQIYRTAEDSDQIAIVHVSPSAAKPENIARAEEASKHLQQSSLWTWASKSFEKQTIQEAYTIENAIVMAKGLDAGHLFEHLDDENKEELLDMRRGALSATAAIVLNFREGCSPVDLEWARDVLRRAIHLPEKPDLMWSHRSIIPWHQAIYVARGLAADLREGTAPAGAVRDLLELIAHPLEVVSLAAFEEACKLWIIDPKLSWAALILAFSLCDVPPRPRNQPYQHGEALHTPDTAQTAVNAALAFYEVGSGWASLPLPAPAWVQVEPKNASYRHANYEEYDVLDVNVFWTEPAGFWHSELAAKLLERIPFIEVLRSDAKSELLNFLDGVLDWTNQKNSPFWVKPGRRHRSNSNLFEWTHTLGTSLGRVAGLLPLSEFQVRFLDPILRLEGENCFALLSPFARIYACAYIYDAPTVPGDAVPMLDLCLGRLLNDSVFERGTYRSGELSGFDQPDLVRTLMFVAVERADLAARYANGDWSEIGIILPLIERFVRSAGWAASVMEPFLTLCEKAKNDYPAEVFADQVIAVIGEGPDNLQGWHGSSLPARIAGLVQYLAHRDAPMKLALSQKFLRILDMLVDMGDRRSAALQLGEAFREVHLPV